MFLYVLVLSLSLVFNRFRSRFLHQVLLVQITSFMESRVHQRQWVVRCAIATVVPRWCPSTIETRRTGMPSCTCPSSSLVNHIHWCRSSFRSGIQCRAERIPIEIGLNWCPWVTITHRSLNVDHFKTLLLCFHGQLCVSCQQSL